MLYVKISYNDNINPLKVKYVKSNKFKVELFPKQIDLNHTLLYFHNIDKKMGFLKFGLFLTYESKIKKFKEIIINLSELLYDKKHLLTINFPYKSKLKLNYIINNDNKELSSFIKEVKNKKTVINNGENNIFNYFEENSKNEIFGEFDSEGGEEDDESVKSSESENIESEEEDDYFFLKPIPPPKLIRSKSQFYKKNHNNINNKENFKKKLNDKLKLRNNIDELIDKHKINKIDIPRKKTFGIKGKNYSYVTDPNSSHIWNMNLNIKRIMPKETILKCVTIDLTKEENKNIKSFCNGFFIASFPYNNAKIIENSKNYRSMCGHLICSKLNAMESTIIYKYPLKDSKDLELNNFCASICFPTGIKVCYNQDRRSTYKSFCTNIVNHKGEKYYMTVFHFYHKMDTLSYNKRYSENSLKNYLRKFGDNIYKNKEEKEKLEKDLEECQELGFREFVYIPYSLALISKYPYSMQMKEVINNIFCIFTNHDGILNNNNLIEKSIINDLITYLIDSIPTPIPNSCIRFNLPFNNNRVEIQSPFNNNIQNLKYGNLLNFFSVENIIIIYRLMLFEQKILFIDKDYNRLTSIIQSFINLLYPIDWVNTLIPIMSEQMTRYLQTFLPFINGISEDLLNNNALNALKEAEDNVYEIFIIKNIIKISNENEEICSGVPKLPEQIYKKLYNELKCLEDIYNKMDKSYQEKFYENINNIIQNIFLESCSIMLYDFIDYIFNDENISEIYDFDIVIKRKDKKDYEFYRELIDTQIFQNFIQNVINNKNNFPLFINTLKNIKEKYILYNDGKNGVIWKSIIERKIKLKDIQEKTSNFNLPNHLIKSSLDNTIKDAFIINKDSWTKINKNYKFNEKDEFISESNRTTNYINIIDEKLYKSKKSAEIFVLPEEINKYKDNINNLEKLEKPIKAIYIKNNKHSLKNEFNLNEEEKEKMKENFKNTIMSLFKNEKNISIDECLPYVYYSTGRDILCKLIYQKGFKVVKKIKEECFMSLAKICLNALIAICNINENEETLDFSVKMTQAGFCFCKEKDVEIFLIDELRSKLSGDYFMWIKKSFWNTWQNMENYFSINDYKSYCDVIKYEFVFKLLRLKIDKEFILNYLKYTLEEKMNLLLEDETYNDDLAKKYSELYSNTKKDLIEIINTANF